MAIQLTSSLLDSCVLSLLKRGNTYGYVLTQDLMSVLEISESTLYPVLRRLQKEGYLDTYDQPFNGRNRRFYKLTDSGQEKLTELLSEWVIYKQNLEKIFYGGFDHE